MADENWEEALRKASEGLLVSEWNKIKVKAFQSI